MSEPLATAALLAIFGALLAVSALFSRAADRINVPIGLVFLLLGMLAGAEGLGGITFDDRSFAFRIGITALALILFDGGLNTPLAAVRGTVAPACVLATAGVAGTALIVAFGATTFGFGWTEALLLGALVSSTDAAAVFSVLRGGGVHLRRRLATTLELESGLNDPMAVLLTAALTTQLLSPGHLSGWRIALDVVYQLALGGAIGAAVGWSGRLVLRRVRLPIGGLYPAFTLALALLSFGVAMLAHSSGFLSVYVTGLVLGNSALPAHSGILRVHDALAWLAQITMFLVLGLLVVPSRLPAVAGPAVALALLLAFVARPAVTALCLLPFRYSFKEIVFAGWVGLRGAVPIVLALFPILAGARGASRLFDVVFFVVVVSTLIPGATVARVTRLLGLGQRRPPAPHALLSIESAQPLETTLTPYLVNEAVAITGLRVADVPLPEGAGITLILRGRDLIPPRDDTVLQPGDHVYVFAREEDRGLVNLLFGQIEEE